MKLYFESNDGYETIIPIYDGEELTDNAIKALLEEAAEREQMNIEPYYRCWIDPENHNRTVCDFGSWAWYFIIER